MVDKLPERVQAQLERLIKEELPVDRIAFMTKLSRRVVEAEIERLNATRQPAGAGR